MHYFCFYLFAEIVALLSLLLCNLFIVFYTINQAIKQSSLIEIACNALKIIHTCACSAINEFMCGHFYSI